MSDRTEPFEPYEPSSQYEWGDEPERHDPPRILWGRVAALVVFGLVALLIGRWSAPSGGSDGELASARRQLASARQEIDTLEQQLDEAQQAATPTTSPSPDGEDETSPDPDSTTHEVEEGDTLATIAEQYYDDPTLDDYIADANGIEDPLLLRVGQELTIPPPPE